METQMLKLKINDKEILNITDTMLKVLGNDLLEVPQEVERRAIWAIMSKYDACFARLQAEWLPKLSSRNIESIPTNKDKFAELVFSQPDYKSRSERENFSERENNATGN